MLYQTFHDKRATETRFIYKRFSGDRQRYNAYKFNQEERKRHRQNAISIEELQQQLFHHDQRFPTWFNVRDGSGVYCYDNLLRTNMITEPDRQVHIPLEFDSDRDLYDVLQVVMSKSIGVEKIHVTCTIGDQTANVPHKTVIMNHGQDTIPIPEAIKHQERQLGPVTIYNVVGGNFKECKRAVLFTHDFIMHTRYLYKDWERFQFHAELPRRDVCMRLGYSVVPETISLITVCTKKTKIVISKATEYDSQKINKRYVTSCIEAADILL